MTGKNRILAAMRHEEPDRVPVFNTFTPEVADELIKLFDKQGFELDIELGHDCVLVELGVFNGFYLDFSKESYIDRWGIKWKRVRNNFGCYMEIDEPPLREIKDIYGYMFPDVNEEPFYKELLSVCETYGNDMAVIGGSISLFENSWYLRGFQNFLSDLILNKDTIRCLLDRVMEYNLQLGFKIIDAGVDILYTGDDFGMQTGLIISHNMWKELFLPRWMKLFGEFKSRNPDILIAYHSDGNILPLIDDLMEAGVDVLNPVQPDCMDPALLKKKYGKRLAYWGTIDVQHTMSLGGINDVKSEVLERLKTVAPGGGLLQGSTHNVQMSENAVQNLIAFYEAVKKYGAYPIRL